MRKFYLSIYTDNKEVFDQLMQLALTDESADVKSTTYGFSYSEICNQVFDAIHQVTELTHAQILSNCRSNEISMARFMAAKMLSDHGMSQKDVGAILKRDHSSVNHQLKQHDIFMEVDAKYRDTFNRIQNISKHE